jgi:transposase
MQGKKEYNEKLFVSFQLSQRIPENNFYRRLKSTLDLSFISRETKSYYGSEGQQSIDPEVFFKFMLVGYLENINSDRKIIEHASMRMDILYFIGYDIDEELPWHSTLSRTRKLYGDEIFISLFRKILSMCIEKGMVSGKRQAIDSAFIKANASLDSLKEKELNSDTQSYLDNLNENDENHKVISLKKIKRVEQRPSHLSNKTHYSSTDPDSRISTKPGKPRQLNYYGQISVDTYSHVICGAMADFADKRDSQSLPIILANTIGNLKKHDILIQEVIADTNYSSGEALKALEFNRITGYIPNFPAYIPTREGFSYDPDNDRYICTQGAHINYYKIQFREECTKKVYRTSSPTICYACPLKATCLGQNSQKYIEDTVDKPLYDRMHERMQTTKAEIMGKIRQSTVEPVLGTLINYVNMKRLNTRGISQANKHVLMAAMTYNLKKYMKYTNKIRNRIVLQVKETLKLTYIYQILSILPNLYNSFRISIQICFHLKFNIV